GEHSSLNLQSPRALFDAARRPSASACRQDQSLAIRLILQHAIDITARDTRIASVPSLRRPPVARSLVALVQNIVTHRKIRRPTVRPYASTTISRESRGQVGRWIVRPSWTISLTRFDSWIS